jgi:voltage-gated potassium channel
VPLVVLGFVWLALLVVEFIWGLNRFLDILSLVIWGIFIVEFAIRFILAPRKRAFLRSNWLTVLSLLLPALRVLRLTRFVGLLRASRATRGLRLVKLAGSFNRGMRALRASMARRGFGYVVALTAIVITLGAAGMYTFESEAGLTSYSSALWWTAMLMTSLGSEYWPQTPEGRVLCFFLSLYGLAVFGYVTATLATFFVGRDADDASAEIAGADELRQLRAEIAALRTELHSLTSRASE